MPCSDGQRSKESYSAGKSLPWLTLGQSSCSAALVVTLHWFILPQEKHSRLPQSAGEAGLGRPEGREGDAGWVPRQLQGEESGEGTWGWAIRASLTYLGCAESALVPGGCWGSAGTGPGERWGSSSGAGTEPEGGRGQPLPAAG